MKTGIKFLLLFSALAYSTAHAQPQKILAMNVLTTSPIADSTDYGVPIIDSTTLFNAAMTVILDNADSIYQLHVKLGSTLHGTEFLSTTFVYGVNGTFGSTTYSQTGNIITLNLGSQIGMIIYYSEIQIEKADHTLEEPVLFSNN